MTGKKLSVSERIIAGVGIFTGGFGKSALKGAKLGISSLKLTKGKGRSKSVNEGIYEFIDMKTGLPYVGRISKNIKKRLKQHEKAGRYNTSSPVKKTQVLEGENC